MTDSVSATTAFQHTRILHDLLWGFALDLPGDVLDVISSPLLIGLDELVKVTLGPNSKTLDIDDITSVHTHLLMGLLKR